MLFHGNAESNTLSFGDMSTLLNCFLQILDIVEVVGNPPAVDTALM